MLPIFSGVIHVVVAVCGVVVSPVRLPDRAEAAGALQPRPERGAAGPGARHHRAAADGPVRQLRHPARARPRRGRQQVPHRGRGGGPRADALPAQVRQQRGGEVRERRLVRGAQPADSGGVRGGLVPRVHDPGPVRQLRGAEDDRHGAGPGPRHPHEQDQAALGLAAQILLRQIYPRQTGELLQIRKMEISKQWSSV